MIWLYIIMSSAHSNLPLLPPSSSNSCWIIAKLHFDACLYGCVGVFWYKKTITRELLEVFLISFRRRFAVNVTLLIRLRFACYQLCIIIGIIINDINSVAAALHWRWSSSHFFLNIIISKGEVDIFLFLFAEELQNQHIWFSCRAQHILIPLHLLYSVKHLSKVDIYR